MDESDNGNAVVNDNHNTIDNTKHDGRTCTLKNTLRNGLVIGALENRYDHQVGEKSEWDVDPVQRRGAAGSEAQPDGGELRRGDGGEGWTCWRNTRSSTVAMGRGSERQP